MPERLECRRVLGEAPVRTAALFPVAFEPDEADDVVLLALAEPVEEVTDPRCLRRAGLRAGLRIPESAIAEYVEARTVEPVRRVRVRYGKAA
ncbi:hypothetical protein ACWDFR_06965 [Streptomyces sp. 900105755]|uniref:hypothetical protein n=1 Tax=Streptomyces sp. NPDC001507 TaxID=3364579 RepID=UPI003681B5A0